MQAEKDGYELSNNNFRKTDNDKFPVMEVFFVNNTVYEDYGYVNIYKRTVKIPQEDYNEILDYAKNNNCKDIKFVRVMKEENDSTTCIYAYEIDASKENIDEKMDELVKQHYEENGGKIYVKCERICRAKS